jgi:Ca2+-binding EF-hand superfamily protein
MRSAFLVLVAALPLAPWLFAAPDRPADPATAADDQEVVILLETRPYRIRLHLQIDGRPFQSGWGDTIQLLFQYLDVDGDGLLSKRELACAPSPGQLLQLLHGVSEVEPEPAPDFADIDVAPTDGKITLAKLKNYYRRTGAGPLQVEWGWRQGGYKDDVLTDALFQHLDRDKDGKLSKEELLAAETVLGKLDTNFDEMISVRELVPNFFGSGITFSTFTGAETQPKDVPIVLLQPGDSVKVLTDRLLARYDKDGNRKLSRKEFGLDKVTFDRLDTDHDGELNEAELARWVDLTPDLEVVAELGGSPRQPLTLIPEREGRSGGLAALVRQARRGSLLVPLPGAQVELIRDRGESNQRQTVRQSLRALFRAADADGNGVLEGKEIYKPPFTLVPILRLADRDGDGKLSEKEFVAFLELQEKLVSTSVFLAVADRGPTLFEFLDADHDGRLSLRELRTAWERLAPWDRDGDGRIARNEVPRQFHLVLSQGQARAAAREPETLAYGPAGWSANRVRGPLWFRKMDRNGDGDVSASEFLGTPEQFRRIDTDGDGLIDLEEAERADRWFRRERP